MQVEYNGERVGPDEQHDQADSRLGDMLNATEELVDEAAARAELAAKDAIKTTRKMAGFSADMMATIVGIDRNSHHKMAGKKQMRRIKADKYKSAGMKQLTYIDLEQIYHELIRWFNVRVHFIGHS